MARFRWRVTTTASVGAVTFAHAGSRFASVAGVVAAMLVIDTRLAPAKAHNLV